MKNNIKMLFGVTIFIFSFFSFDKMYGERSYLAIPLKSSHFDGVKKYITRKFRKDFSLKFNSQGNQHITLVFFDDLPKKKLELAQKVIQEAIDQAPIYSKLELEIPKTGSLSFFGSNKDVVVYKLAKNDVLEELVNEIKFFLKKKGIKYSDIPFSAHVTIGRLKKRPSKRVCEDKIWEDIQPPRKYKKPFSVEKIKLFVSKCKCKYQNAKTFTIEFE